jgi:hypothetical protein
MRTRLSRVLLAVVPAMAVMCSPTLVSSAHARTLSHHRSHHHSHQYSFRHYGYHRQHQHRAVVALHVIKCSPWHCRRTIKAAHAKTRMASSRAFASYPSNDSSSSLGSVGGALSAKAHGIVSSCGSTVISGFRRGARVAGTNHPSLHASGRAVDIRGNPQCIYAHLHGWSGGFSTDYGSVQHVHISLGGREDGMRFSHHASHHSHHRRVRSMG